MADPGRNRTVRLGLLVAGAATVLAAASAPASAQTQSNALELAVKATYLYKLAPFVEWPPAAYADAASPLIVCVQGDDAFSGLVERAVAGQKIGAHPVEAKRIAKLAPDGGCHIAYVAGSPAQSQLAALQAVRGSPVLTVTDQAKEGAKGVVDFRLDQGKVRFDIDKTAADSAGLMVSSKLLSLAMHVRTR